MPPRRLVDEVLLEGAWHVETPVQYAFGLGQSAKLRVEHSQPREAGKNIVFDGPVHRDTMG